MPDPKTSSTGREATGRFATTDVTKRSNVLNALKFSGNVALQGSTVTLQSVLGQAVDELTGDFAEAIQLFAGSLANNTRRNRDVRLQKMHAEVARRGQSAMLRAYNTSHPRRAGYPKNSDRYAGGVLRNALNSPTMVRGQYDGIIFGDIRLLDQTAKQWYRLNFGVGTKGASRARGGGGSKRRGPTGIELFNETVFRMSLRDNTISNSGDRLPMPPGFFIRPGGERLSALFDGLSYETTSEAVERSVPARPLSGRSKGKDFFKPVHREPTLPLLRSRPNFFGGRKRTRGIAGSYYLDEGVKVIARELGPAWSNLISVWFDEADRAVEASPVFKKAKKTGQEGRISQLNAAVKKKANFANDNLEDALRF